MQTDKTQEMPRAYNPSTVEGPIYQFWMDNDLFRSNADPNKNPFVVIMPPPNVTGELHLGHALTASIEDILVRWHRMLGEATLWLPGKDHAGIATQVVVERQLAQEGTSRVQLGRAKFVERVWEWVAQYGNRIDEQHKRLGASCDWTRLSFTLDPEPSRAVRTTFVNLYKKGLIYRGERIINWCIRCATALSDLEVEYQEIQGQLYYVKYQLVNQEGHITVATTRPETLMGDTGIAVHPNDDRYGHLVGCCAYLPLIGRQLSIVGDTMIDPDFGTGALKVTPGHDQTDFEIGHRHGLHTLSIIGFDGKMTAEAGPFAGMDRDATRTAVVEELEQKGFLEKTESYTHSIGHCQRCTTVVEPLVSKQWFVKIQPLADPAIKAVKDKRIRIVPERFERVYLNWMENIRDWCISRQLWWGHRIPVWYCESCDGIMVSMDDPTVCETCNSPNIAQDPDVLDTWFSSGLWTHSTLGWPKQSQDLDYFYPGSVMETGYDILFFWVARMIMLGIENIGEPPFHTVFLHGLIRDAQGAKMSKTRGNVLDPLRLIDIYGTDALRFALTTGTAPGNDLRLGDEKLEASRNFANKIWNASRYVLRSLDNGQNLGISQNLDQITHRQDRWIIGRLNQVSGQVDHYLNRYEIGEAQREIYEFLWGDFCDWYIELAKIRLNMDTIPSPLPTLAHVLEQTLRLLHPFMPFITEEIWQRLTSVFPRQEELPKSIMLAEYPKMDPDLIDSESQKEMDALITLVKAVRNIRAQLRIDPNSRIDAVINPQDWGDMVDEESSAITGLARLRSLTVIDKPDKAPRDVTVTLLAGDMVIGLVLGDVVDLKKERQRLKNEFSEAKKNLDRIKKLLSNTGFVSKAPESVVNRETERANGLHERCERLKEVLTQLEA